MHGAFEKYLHFIKLLKVQHFMFKRPLKYLGPFHITFQYLYHIVSILAHRSGLNAIKIGRPYRIWTNPDICDM